MRQRGLTLREVLISTVVVMLVAAVLFTAWQEFGPARFERHAARDMRQILKAINVYMQEHDGLYPLYVSSLPAGTPKRLEGWERETENPLYSSAGRTSPEYYLTFHYVARLTEYNRQPRHPWDADKYPILRSPLVKERGWEDVEAIGACGSAPVVTKSLSTDAFVGYLDGRMQWEPYRNKWHDENTACIGIGSAIHQAQRERERQFRTLSGKRAP